VGETYMNSAESNVLYDLAELRDSWVEGTQERILLERMVVGFVRTCRERWES
jgi:hypothetical protein